MKRLLVLCCLVLNACSGQASVLDLPIEEAEPHENVLIVVGEGGTSSHLFTLAALTYQRETGGTLIEVHSGDEFVEQVKAHVQVQGPLTHMEYFGHGNNVALFVNQEPGVNGSLYANDPSYNENFRAASIYDLSPDIFATGATTRLNGCNVAQNHEVSETFAQDFANHFQVVMTAAQGPTQFSSHPEEIVTFDEWNQLKLTSADNVYMIPSYQESGFVTLHPAAPSRSGYVDVYRGDLSTESIDWLVDHGIDFGDEFRPYEHVTADDLVFVCEGLALVCDTEGGSEDQKMLEAMAILIDAHGWEVVTTVPWYDAYVRVVQANELLPSDFSSRRWMTRADMAILLHQLSLK